MQTNPAGAAAVPAVDPVVPEDVQAWSKDHQEDHPHTEQDEGAGHEGELLQVPPGQRARHGGRLQGRQRSLTQPRLPPGEAAPDNGWIQRLKGLEPYRGQVQGVIAGVRGLTPA